MIIFNINLISPLVQDDLVSELVFSFFKRFGHAECCFDDLKAYLRYVSKDQSFVDKLQSLIVTDEHNAKKTIQNISRTVNLKKIQRYLASLHPNITVNRMELLKELCEHYLSSIPHSKDQTAKEKKYGDDFLMLSAHYLLDEYISGKKDILSISL